MQRYRLTFCISDDLQRLRYVCAVPHDVRPVYEVKAGLFRVLGHPARVRIVELLRGGERSVGALQAELGLESGATSQHLAALRRVGLVEARRDGTSVFYRAADEKVFELLEAGRALVTRQLEGQQSMLRELAES
jgi:DNA-binding transcriptional ArsR family regulator